MTEREVSSERVSEEAAWRNLALQFDGHRIDALSMLRFAVRCIEEYATVRDILKLPLSELKAFLAKPPLSGDEVLKQRIELLSLRSSVKTAGNNDGWFALRGDERLGRCATEGCGGQPAFRLEAGGTGSDYCSGCAERIKSLSAIEVPAAEGEQIDKTLLHGICDSLRVVIMEYEDMDMFPGSRAITQGQLDALTSALKGDRP